MKVAVCGCIFIRICCLSWNHFLLVLAAFDLCVKNYAEQVLTKTAWAYYRSTGDDEYTYWENFESFKRFWFRPRV